jgi:phosphoglycolate phosphatase
LQESFAKLVGADRAPTLLSLFRERYSTIGLFENSLYDGVVEALDRLTALDYRLFVATTKVEPDARRILDHFDLTRYFKQIYGAEMDGRRSAKSELLTYLLGRERISETRRVVMIGDRRYDALGARAVGIRAIGALWGYGDAEELAAAGADPLITAPRQIPEAVAAVFAQAG